MINFQLNKLRVLRRINSNCASISTIIPLLYGRGTFVKMQQYSLSKNVIHMFYVRPGDYCPKKPQTNKADHYDIKQPPTLINKETTYVHQQEKQRYNKSQSKSGNKLEMKYKPTRENKYRDYKVCQQLQ